MKATLTLFHDDILTNQRQLKIEQSSTNFPDKSIRFLEMARVSPKLLRAVRHQF